MKQEHRASLAAIVTAAICVVPMTAHAGLESANAHFSSTDPSGCITTEVFVLVNHGTLGGPANQADALEQPSLRISQVDDCRKTPLINAFGFVQRKGNAFKLDNTLASAMLDATISVFDQISARNLDIDVSLVWSATGGIINTANDIYFQSPGQVFKEKKPFQGTYRSAQASGAVFLNTTNFTPNPSEDAEVSELK